MIAGVDGTSKGWVAVISDDNLKNPKGHYLNGLVDLPRDLRIAAVDIPIGLPEKGGRDADFLVRKTLGEPRRRSVFPPPIRSVLGATSREEASARTVRADGRRVSRQTYSLLSKIAEADVLVRSDAWAREVIHEIHPEMSFAKWSGAPMLHGKKSPAGRDERLRLIAATFGAGVFEEVWESLRRHQVEFDDVTDAFAAAWTASRICAGNAERFPEETAVDAEGVAMHIWA